MRARSIVLAAALAAGCGRAAAPAPEAGVVRIEAKRFAFTPDTVTLKRGVPATLELVSLDRKHGFKVEGLGVRADVVPGAPARLTVTPKKAGTYPFRCDLFCGSGHEGMQGKIVVVE